MRGVIDAGAPRMNLWFPLCYFFRFFFFPCNFLLAYSSLLPQLGVLGAHLATLVQLLKVGLENARDVFRVDGDDPNWRNGWQVSKMHEVHLLELQAEANRLDSVVNTDFVGYIQAFLERCAID